MQDLQPAVLVVPGPRRAPGEPQEAAAGARGRGGPAAGVVVAGEAEDARVLGLRAGVRDRAGPWGPHAEAPSRGRDDAAGRGRGGSSGSSLGGDPRGVAGADAGGEEVEQPEGPVAGPELDADGERERERPGVSVRDEDAGSSRHRLLRPLDSCLPYVEIAHTHIHT